MKKIISLLAAMTMMFSVSSMVFAAIPDDATAPKATFVIEDTGETDPDAGTLYAMTVDLTDIGTVTHEKNSATKFSGTKIVQFNYEMHGENLLFVDSSGELSTAGWQSGDSSEFTGIYVSYANTTAKTAYPAAGTATDCEAAVTVQFFALPGTKIDLSAAKIGYATFSENTPDLVQYLPVTFDQTSFVVGEVPVEELALTVTPEARQTNGYVWTADITKGANDITSFTAKFTADGETADRAISNIDAVNKFLGEGSTQFNIGLKTAKELTAVEFAVSDGATTATANPAVSQ